MNQIYPDDGLDVWTDRLLVGDFRYRLFTNNIVPDRDTVLADLTEAVFGGYSFILVVAADFVPQAISGHVKRAIAPAINFSNGSGSAQNVYGYYATKTDDTNLLLVARFDGAPVSIPDGGLLPVIPIIGDYSKLSS